jgi:hypothetical protein
VSIFPIKGVLNDLLKISCCLSSHSTFESKIVKLASEFSCRESTGSPRIFLGLETIFSIIVSSFITSLSAAFAKAKQVCKLIMPGSAYSNSTCILLSFVIIRVGMKVISAVL